VGIDISNGLKYFEKKNLLHKDIKLGNILVCENMKIKIGNILFLSFSIYLFHNLFI
jgi:serine/threonine protein kinase